MAQPPDDSVSSVMAMSFRGGQDALPSDGESGSSGLHSNHDRHWPRRGDHRGRQHGKHSPPSAGRSPVRSPEDGPTPAAVASTASQKTRGDDSSDVRAVIASPTLSPSTLAAAAESLSIKPRPERSIPSGSPRPHTPPLLRPTAAAAGLGPQNAVDSDSDETLDGAEGAAQAAHGAIVVDVDEVSTDAGYETDSMSSASTSLSSSVREYAFENGRRYHKFREGRYNFPNDDVEQEREDMKHAMVSMLCQRLYFAPIGEHPQEILDIGTGTGMWAIEMGDRFESANILGIDLSPIQPGWVPPNVRFMVDDVESPWLHPSDHFDYIHARHTVMAIKDWPKLLLRAKEHLRPGGWMELQEIHHFPASLDGSMPPDHPVAQYWAHIDAGLAQLGVDFQAARGGHLAALLRDAGFAAVTERVFYIPIGTWPKNRVLKTVGLYWRTVLLDGIQAIALGPLTRGLHWNRDRVELFLVNVRRAYFDNACLMFMPLRIVYGQKPWNGP